MSKSQALIDCEAIRGRFQEWQAEQEPLEAQLRESLEALSAYQAHLDGWQQQLSREREELRTAREQLDQDRAAGRATDAQLSSELDAARDKTAALTTLLLARTEELRTLDSRRAELNTELELMRAREKEFKNSMEELKTARELERIERSEEIQHLRDLLERRLESPAPELHAPPSERPAAPARPAVKKDDQGANPVLTSVMEQFGKLRQQRAQDRPTYKKSR